MSLLPLNFMQSALHLIAAILLGLCVALCLFPGPGLGGHNGSSTVLLNGQGLAAFAALLAAITTLWAIQCSAGEDRDGSEAWRRVGIHTGRGAFLKFSCKTPPESVNSFICNGR